MTRTWLAHHRFAAVAARAGGRVAVTSAGGDLTYRELDAWANRLAHLLHRSGVTVDEPVAVLVDKARVDFVAAALAVWKAGAAYLPLDPRTPAARLSAMLEAAGARVVVAAAEQTRPLGVDTVLDPTDPRLARMPADEPPAVAIGPEHLAYVVHTSGSSGEPKAVAVPHRALVSVYRGWADRYRLTAIPPTCLQAAGPAFDVHVGDLARALLSGGRLVLCEPQVVLEPPLLADVIRRAGVDVVELTPTVWRLVAGWLDGHGTGLASLRLAISGGEQMTADDFRRLRGVLGGHTQIVNSYGVAEAGIDSTYLYLTAEHASGPEPVPIGHPFPGAAVAVLDDRLRPVPPGQPGELYLGGAGLARGYHRRPDLTAERFLPAVAGLPGPVMYRTGDLVRQRADGALVHIGRVDDEVKIRGVRVGLSAVESVLRELPAVADAAVTVVRRAGEDVLVAHLTLRAGTTSTPRLLRAEAADRLPPAMVPAEVHVRATLPVALSGKTDRRALAPDLADLAGPAVMGPGPASPAEEVVLRAWTAVLGRPPADKAADLFAEGATSLTAARLVATLRAEAGVEVSLAAVLGTPTFAAIAGLLGSAAPATPITAAAGDLAPLTPAQRGLWLHDRLHGSDPAYHIPTLVQLTGPLDEAALRAALDHLVERHDALRTSFLPHGRAQRVEPSMPFPLDTHDGADPAQVLDELVRRPFDLTRAPLTRGALVRLGPRRHALALVTHHIVFDDWSERILLRDLGHLYSFLATGRPSAPLPAIPRHADVAAWRRARPDGAGQRAHWRSRLAALPARLDLPAAAPGTPRGAPPAVRSVVLPPVLTAHVEQVASAYGATPYVVLLAAFAALLRRWCGEDDFVVGVPFGYRDRPETQDLVGFLVSTLPLRLRVRPEHRFTDVLDIVRRELATAAANPDVPFDELTRQAGRAGVGDRNPVFRVWFNWLGAPAEPPAMSGVRAEVAHLTVPAPLFDLAVYVSTGTDGYRLDVVLDGTVLDARYLRPLSEQYLRLLAALCRAPDEPVSAPRLRASGDSLPTGTENLRTAVPSLVGGLQAAAAENAGRVAIREAGGEVRYAALYRSAARVSATLRKSGVRPGDVVPVYAHRSAALVPVLLGVLGAGATFSILDSGYPAARLAAQLAVTKGRIGIRTGADPPAPLREHCPTWLALPGLEAAAWPLVPDGTPGYLAFTSGTGAGPKPVRSTAGPLAHFLTWYTRRYRLGPDDRFAMLSGLGHDPLLRDMLTPLWIGGTLCVPPPGLLSRPRDLRDWLRAEAVTVLHLTPASCRMLATSGGALLDQVRLLVCGGDALYAADLPGIRRWAPNATVVNAYGTTETPQVFSLHEVAPGRPPGDRVPVGVGVPGAELLVLDVVGRPAAIGERGPLVARGVHLALANGVVADPVPGHGRFPTGDLGRYGPGGEVTLLGRSGDQVQLRGFRVELVEVERCLLGHAAVGDAACRVLPGPGGELQLVAYVVPAGEPERIADRLRAHVRALLPEHMVPARVVTLDAIPLTPNRKPDRAALPVPEPEPAGADSLATELEQSICAVWREVLRVGHLDVDRNFFDLGADSVALVSAQAGLEAALARDVPLTALFEHTTVRALAAYLAGGEGAPLERRRRPAGARSLRERRAAARRG